jgi:hypothetical protein
MQRGPLRRLGHGLFRLHITANRPTVRKLTQVIIRLASWKLPFIRYEFVVPARPWTQRRRWPGSVGLVAAQQVQNQAFRHLH